MDPYSERLAALYELLSSLGLSGVAIRGLGVTGSYGLFTFFTGAFPSIKGSYVVLGGGSEATLVVGSRHEAAAAMSETDGRLELAWPTGGCSRMEVVAGLLRDCGEETGRNDFGWADSSSSGLPCRDLEALEACLEGSDIRDCGEELQDLKVSKNSHDRQRLSASVRQAEVAIDEFSRSCSIGISEREGAAIIRRALTAQGAPTSIVHVSAGPYFGQEPTDRRMREGDLVTVMAEGATPDGYWAELGAIFLCGLVSPRARRLVTSCHEMLKAGCEALSQGATVGDVHQSLTQKSRMLGTEMVEGIGHAVGIDEELPVIARDAPNRLQSGDLFALHPGLADEDAGLAASACNTYAVTTTGGTPLSSYPSHEWRID